MKVNKKVVLIASVLTVLGVGLAGIGFALASPATGIDPARDLVERPVAVEPPAGSGTPTVAVDPALPRVAIPNPLEQPPISIDPRHPPIAVDPILGHVPPVAVDPIPGHAPPVAIDPVLGTPSEGATMPEIVTTKPLALDRPVDGIIPPPTS